MEKIRNVLVAVQRSESARSTLAKSVKLARRFGASLELFLCDAERAFALNHEYDPHSVERIRQFCVQESRRYLETLLSSVDASGVRVTIDATCASPEYEAITRKVLDVKPDLVIRNIGRERSAEPTALTEGDWDLIRVCPAPLLLTRGAAWVHCPNVVAAVDISADEAPELTKVILQAANYLSAGCDAELEVVYCASTAATLSADRLELRKQIDLAAVPAAVAEVIAGDPARALPKFMKSAAYDVVVLGALTHRKSLAALVGTLTGALLDSVASDFLLVKSPAYVCAIADAAQPAQTSRLAR